MQCQAVPDAVRSFRRYGHTRNFHLDPVARIILDFNIAIQAKPSKYSKPGAGELCEPMQKRIMKRYVFQ